MASRNARLSPIHIEALNLIDLEFYDGMKHWYVPRRPRSFTRVRKDWKAYHDHLATNLPTDQNQIAIFFAQRDNLFVDLLYDGSRTGL